MKIISRQIVQEIGILIGIAIIIAFLINSLSPRGIALIGQWDVDQGVITAKARDDSVQPEFEIQHIQEAKALYDSGELLFIDARVEEDYAEGHILEAVSLPVNHFDDLIDDFFSNYSMETAIVTYCSGRECDDSHLLAEYLRDVGYLDVRVFIDGFPAWKEAGFPID